MTDYSLAPEAAEIARPLIQEHHRHLLDVRIEYLFSPMIKRGGRPRLAKAMLVTGSLAFVANGDTPDDAPQQFFLLVFSSRMWGGLTLAQRQALVDHGLCHCKVLDGKLSLCGPDVEEFRQVIKRHGLWQPDLRAFADAVEQRQQISLVPKPVPT